jgi:GNAT superfamily N-acetyltransferase
VYHILSFLPSLFHWLIAAVVVNILAVRPEYQRKGLGGMLFEDGLALADRDSCKTFIKASAKGLGLYLKYGWKEIDEVKVDTRPYG